MTPLDKYLKSTKVRRAKHGQCFSECKYQQNQWKYQEVSPPHLLNCLCDGLFSHRTHSYHSSHNNAFLFFYTIGHISPSLLASYRGIEYKYVQNNTICIQFNTIFSSPHTLALLQMKVYHITSPPRPTSRPSDLQNPDTQTHTVATSRHQNITSPQSAPGRQIIFSDTMVITATPMHRQASETNFFLRPFSNTWRLPLA